MLRIQGMELTDLLYIMYIIVHYDSQLCFFV